MPTYNGEVSPTNSGRPSRRRPVTPEEGTAGLDTGAGTMFGEVFDVEAPAEPAWLQEADDAVRPVDPAAPPDAEAERRRTEAAASREREIIARLNPEQTRAVTTTDGPVLILAGAGSGKTRVLAHRVAYLIGVKGVPPWRILAVTFTNRAAAELRERIVRLVGEAGKEVEAGTFHALCARLLRREGEAIGLDRRFLIYDTDDQNQLMKQILREEGMEAKGETRPQAILGAISRAKNDMVDPTEIPPMRDRDGRTGRGRSAGTEISGCAQALECARLRRPPPRGVSAPRGIAGDPREVPGTLALPARRRVPGHEPAAVPLDQGPRRRTTTTSRVVGDDDQSIYGWRGADIRNILDFERDWPDATVVKLEQNYRSTQLILDAAHAVVSRNEARTDKKLWTKNDRRPADRALRGLQRGRGGRVDRPPGRGAGRAAAVPR